MPSEVWDEITDPFRNFKGAAVQVTEWISNSTPHFIMLFIMVVITYSYWNQDDCVSEKKQNGPVFQGMSQPQHTQHIKSLK